VLSREERLERVSLALGGLLQAEGWKGGAGGLGNQVRILIRHVEGGVAM
jgi:hypothetical protein